MPDVSQDSLWQTTEKAFKKDRFAWHNPPHAGLDDAIKIYQCPSETRKMLAESQEGPLPPPVFPVTTATMTHYLAVNGTNLKTKDGVFIYDQWIKIQQIKDGTSNTILVGERPPPTPYKFGWWYAGTGQFSPQRPGSPTANFDQLMRGRGIYSGSLSQTLGAAEINTRSSGYKNFDSCPPGPYSYGPGSYRNPCDAFHFWSLHQGGANFLFGDGSVHFLNYSIGDNLAKLATRAGNEVNNFDY